MLLFEIIRTNTSLPHPHSIQSGYDQYGQYQPQQQSYQPNYDTQQQQQQQQPNMALSNSIGSLAPMNPNGGTNNASSASLSNHMIKTDSHAVLMELFARDQDLVRQAAGKSNGGGGIAAAAVQQQQQVQSQQQVASAGGGGLQGSGQSGNLRFSMPASAGVAQGGTPSGSMGQKQLSVTFDRVPTLASWPHFSSVSSLNNLGGIQGVKSITNLSAADLSSQGNLNKMGNLAQVKSIENMVSEVQRQRVNELCVVAVINVL